MFKQVRVIGTLVSATHFIMLPVFFLVLGLMCANVQALSTDSQQPIEIEADFAELDDQEGRTIYVGNVIVTQGSIKMTGDKLKVLFDENRDLEHAHMEGRPAY